MTRVIIFHGGEAFNSYESYLDWLKNTDPYFDSGRISWKKSLKSVLELTGRYEVLLPNMPCRENASYDEWVVVLEKIKPLITKETVLIGHSLGGIFVAAYLAEHKLGIKQLHLVASPFEAVGTFVLPKVLLQISQNCLDIHLWHSIDDQVVNFNDVLLYKKNLPQATLHQYLNSGHFNQDRFFELEAEILKIGL